MGNVPENVLQDVRNMGCEEPWQVNRRLWVAALRSGEYEQTQNVLSCDGAYCCLGVACEVYNKFNPDNPLVVERDTVAGDRYDGQTAYLPTKVRKWLNINHCGSLSNLNTLSVLNDVAECTFEQIADEIESGKLAPYTEETSNTSVS